MPSSQGASGTRWSVDCRDGGGFHVQDVASKRGILIPDGLFHVLLTMPDLVTLSVDPSLVAIGFGLSEQLFRSGSSTHLGYRKSGRRYVKGGGPRAARSRDEDIRGGRKGEKGTLERRDQRRAGAIYRVPSAMVGPRPAKPGAVEQRLVEGAKWETLSTTMRVESTHTRTHHAEGARSGEGGAMRTQRLTRRG